MRNIQKRPEPKSKTEVIIQEEARTTLNNVLQVVRPVKLRLCADGTGLSWSGPFVLGS